MSNKFSFRRYLSIRVLPIWAILLFDVFIVAVSCMAAYVLRYNLSLVLANIEHIDIAVLWCVGVNLVFFKLFKTYSGVLRYSSFVDILRIFVALAVAYAVLMVLRIVTNNLGRVGLPGCSLLLVAFMFNFGLMAISRVIAKQLFESLNVDYKHKTNVFIYGAKEIGVNIAKSLRVNLSNRYILRGFIADEPELIGKVLMGVKVYANNGELADRMAEQSTRTIIVSPAKMEELKKSDMADRLLVHNIKLMTAPPLSEWNGQALSRTQLKEIQIEDLLQRNPIEIDIHKVASHLEGKRVMITGAAGSIGSEIMRQVASFNPYKLILVDQAETLCTTSVWNFRTVGATSMPRPS